MSDAITIRSLTSHAEYAACVELQRDTWGSTFNDAVPASILQVAQKVGGVTAGAFTPEGVLVGFVFGITGVENGNIVHWSDMLAVRPEAQNLGLGRRLKEFQRDAVSRLGATVIYWTFDPLVARNAHLNFNVFGVRAVRYARDMYGSETGSDLHRGIGTDRLIVAWPVPENELAKQKHDTRAALASMRYADAPIAGDAEQTAHQDVVIGSSDRMRIAVPVDVAEIQQTDASRAARWRASTRRAFENALAQGFQVCGFKLDPPQQRGFYLLGRSSS